MYERPESITLIDDLDALEHAEVMYSEELGSVYQPFASRVSAGFRTRQNATGIYAHAMAVCLEATDEQLVRGISLDEIFAIASGRESRIQKGNLRTALAKIPSMQVDDAGRGLVLSYADDLVRVVDRQLLLYRKYATMRWPWEDLIAEADTRSAFSEGD